MIFVLSSFADKKKRSESLIKMICVGTLTPSQGSHLGSAHVSEVNLVNMFLQSAIKRKNIQIKLEVGVQPV